MLRSPSRLFSCFWSRYSSYSQIRADCLRTFLTPSFFGLTLRCSKAASRYSATQHSSLISEWNSESLTVRCSRKRTPDSSRLERCLSWTAVLRPDHGRHRRLGHIALRFGALLLGLRLVVRSRSALVRESHIGVTELPDDGVVAVAARPQPMFNRSLSTEYD